MKQFFIVILALLTQIGVAQKQSQVTPQDYLDKQKVILQFAPKTSLSEKATILKKYAFISNWTPLPYPDVTIAVLDPISDKAYQNFIKNIQTNTSIVHVGKYYTNTEGHSLGILSQVMIQLRKADDYHLLEKMAKKYNLERIEAQRIPNLYKLQVSQNTPISPLDLAIQLHQSNQFVYAEPNYLVNPIVTTNDSLYNRQWAINNAATGVQYSGTLDADMDVDDAWNITTGESYVKIAVLDSGVDTLHPDLTTNLLPGYSAVGDNSNGYPNFNYPSDGHGTCCAGIIAAEANNNIGIAGVAPDCKIIPIKVFYYQNAAPFGVIPYSTTAWMADAITWAWQSGDAAVLSNSWGDTSTVNAAINLAYTSGRQGKGSLLFFSSGNDGDPPIWPSNRPEAIAVNATSMCDERKYQNSCDGESWEGNYGAGLELGAPGVKIATTDALGSNGYTSGDYETTFNGTSAACPNAAAVMGLILSVDTTLSAERARAIIDTTAERVSVYSYTTNSQYPYGTWSTQLGYGRVNAYLAVAKASGIVTNTFDAEAVAHFELYPNPATHTITVSHQLEQDTPLSLTIYSSLGQVVQTYQITDLDQSQLSLDQLNNGTYYIVLSTEKSSATKKLTVLR